MRNAFVDFENGFGIAAAPKVGTKSIIDFFFALKHGRPPESGEATHHLSKKLSLAFPATAGFAAGLPMVAVHRDPYERLRSAYQHRVVHEKEAPARNFRAFCERLGYYRGFRDIAWHTDPQVHWLGENPGVYSAVLTLDELHLLPETLSGLTGRSFPAMPWKHRMTSKVPWEEGLKELLEPWAMPDLSAGWSGKKGMASENTQP